METDESEGSENRREPDDDMPLLQFQRDIKLEALAHKDTRRRRVNPKKEGIPLTLSAWSFIYLFFSREFSEDSVLEL